MQIDPTREIEKRAQRYWYEDGIWEIGFGLANALLGCLYLVTNQMDWSGYGSLALTLVQLAGLIAMFWMINPFVKFLKERITYPRTGYVAYRKPARRSRVYGILKTMLLAAAVGALIGVLAATRFGANRMALIVSVIMGGTLVYLGYRFDLLRLYAAGALTVLWGYLVSLFIADYNQSTSVYFIGFGSLILLIGLATLLTYIRRTRPAGEHDDYEAPDGSSGKL
jgi:hypothetical protein